MKTLFIIAAILLAATAAYATDGQDVIGSWQAAGNSSQLEIYPCGDKLCGKVAWLKHPNFMDAKDGPIGTTKIDLKNPDPALRNRPILGLRVMEGLTPTGNDSWEQGKCYDPESGNTYKCRMHLASPEKLEMRGFIGIPLFGRTYVLTRQEKPGREIAGLKNRQKAEN
jgi:uncharacterized protein (DUF2147 family)